MNKQKKSKLDILLERAAKEYAEKIIVEAKSMAEKNDAPMTEAAIESMRSLIESTYIAGECHMYRMLIAETAPKKKKAR